MKPKLNLPAIKRAATSFGKQISKKLPSICTGLGVGGLFLTTGLTVKATVSATRKVDALKAEKQRYAADGEIVKVTPKEVVQLCWRDFIAPTAALAGTTATTIIGHSKLAHNNAALLAGYGVMESSLREQKEALREVLGEKKAAEVENKVAEKVIEKTVVNLDNVIHTGYGETLFIDKWTGRIFYCDLEVIRQKRNEFNLRLFGDIQLSINDFYDYIGLDRVDSGDDFGWDSNIGGIDINFGYGPVKTMDGKPAIIMEFDTAHLKYLPGMYE